MTKTCKSEVIKLEELLRTEYFEDVTTEIILCAYIGLNDAEDIYDCLLSMTRDLDNKFYSNDVKIKLGNLKKRLTP